MAKHNNDFDNVFKTLKVKHSRLFIPVINEAFGTHYDMETSKLTLLETDGYLTPESADGTDIEERVSDFLLKIENTTYLLECQSYDDDSMAIRIAEYAFIASRQSAKYGNGWVKITLPHYAVIYVRSTAKTPKETKIRFEAPDGQVMDYNSRNILLKDYSKEDIIEKKLFPYIPFYILRYEKEMSSNKGNIDQAISDLEFFNDAINTMASESQLTGEEAYNLANFINTIIKHVTDGNQKEERMVNIMGGTVIKTPWETRYEEGMQQGMQQERTAMLNALSEMGVSMDILEKAIKLSESQLPKF